MPKAVDQQAASPIDRMLANPAPNPNDVGPIAPADDRGQAMSGADQPFSGTLTGKARFDWINSNRPSSLNPEQFDLWWMSLPEDPNDIEYTMLLRQAKSDAQLRKNDRAWREAGKEQNSGEGQFIRGLPGAKPPPQSGQFIRDLPGDPPPPVAGQFIRGLDPPSGAKALPGQPNPERKNKQAEQRNAAKASGPIILGLQAGAKDVFGDPNNPAAPPDPYVQDWVKGQELQLSTNSKQIALKTGQWVYVGSVADPESGTNRTRPVYSYADEAKSGLANMSSDQIKGYERQLGLPETGMVSPELQSIWTEAVTIGQSYAQQGKRVELQFIFDTRLAAKVAKMKASGGGGSQFAKETPEDMAGATYYQAMMAILGDTSGVNSAKSKP